MPLVRAYRDLTGQWLPVAHADIDDAVRVNDGNPVPVCAVLVPDDPALSVFPPTAPAGWRFAECDLLAGLFAQSGYQVHNWRLAVSPAAGCS
jgi:hypothetical protein